jgi:UDP-N-acetylmuramoyl-L-alanyl-D-glutamate--2,6-diaminopimelate ligase
VSPGTPGQRPPLRPRSTLPRSLAELPTICPAVRVGVGDPDRRHLRGVTHDSRAVQPGDLYAALPGSRQHGATFAGEAAAAGAQAVLTDPPGLPVAGPAGLPVLVAADPRAVLGRIASWIYGEPSRRLALTGITGTNGKTTTSYLVESGLRAAGLRTGLVGTVETRIGDQRLPAVRTTPEAPDLQALLAVMAERGVAAAAMEVSSHALALHRVDGTRFRVVGFTGLSRDHLDFHGTLEAYYAAKARLFRPDFAEHAVVAVDDPAGARLATELRRRGDLPLTTAAGRPGAEADWQVLSVDGGPDGSRASVRGPAGVRREISVALPGSFNIVNAVVALALLTAGGIPVDDAVAGLARLAGVPGRMERVAAGQPFLALVDYAHTPDAVARLLAAVRELVPGRVICVLGCGGERDVDKRPMMGAAAHEGADLAVFTSDNPRGEDPDAILGQMLAGVPGGGYVVEPDRRSAIRLAVCRAGPGDAVVVAGKGHETGQEVAGAVIPFEDRTVLAEALADRERSLA